MEIADGVFTYRGRGGEKIKPGAGSSNVTVIRGDGLVMIDPGVAAGGALDDVVSGMKRDGLDPQKIRWLLFTHAHWDHFNAAGSVVVLSGARTATSEGESPFAEDAAKNFNAFIIDFGPFAREIFPFPMFIARLLVRYAWGRQPKLGIDRRLADGDQIDDTREIRAISLPGHTDGHTGYFIPDAGVLVSGDLVDFDNSVGMDFNNPRSSFEAAAASIKRAVGIGADILIPGHGEPLVGPKNVQTMLQGAYDGGMQYPVLIQRALGETPLVLKEIFEAVFPNNPFSTEAMRMMLVLIVLLYMERSGEAARVEKKGRPAWVLGENRK